MIIEGESMANEKDENSDMEKPVLFLFSPNTPPEEMLDFMRKKKAELMARKEKEKKQETSGVSNMEKEIIDPRKGKLIFLGRPEGNMDEFINAVVEAIFAESSDPNVFIPKDNGEMVEEPGVMVKEGRAKAQSPKQAESQQKKEE
jgi:hypothetical protein